MSLRLSRESVEEGKKTLAPLTNGTLRTPMPTEGAFTMLRSTLHVLQGTTATHKAASGGT